MSAGSILEQVRSAATKIRERLFRARAALNGRCNFTAEDVRDTQRPIQQMAGIMEQARHLRTLQPELDTQLEIYAADLEELQEALQHIRFMLIARRASLHAALGQMQAVSQWGAALRETTLMLTRETTFEDFSSSVAREPGRTTS